MVIEEVKYGIITARYQPVHNGHLIPIMAALERCGELFIGVAFPNPPNTYQEHPSNPKVTSPENNPFSYFERLIMLQRATREKGIEEGRIHIVPYESGTLMPNWALNSYFPNGTWYFYMTSNWDHRKMIAAKDRHRTVEVLGENRGDRIHGDDIRGFIATNNDKWKSLVPKSVAEYIIQINGIERIQKLYSEDDR